MPATTAAARDWVAAVLSGRPALPPVDDEAALAATVAEAVVCQAQARLLARPDAARRETLMRRLLAASHAEAARSLLQARDGRRVLDALAAQGIPVLVLKGLALSCWLYDEPHLREVGDIDLLLPSRAAAGAAVMALRELGYDAAVDEIPGDLVSYEVLCTASARGAARTDVDLHWKVCNSPLYADCLRWDELVAEAMPLPGLGPAARGLGAVHAFVNACVHRAHGLQYGDGDRLRWLLDIDLLARRFVDAEWRRLVELASARAIAGACLHGLRAAQADLATPVAPWIVEALATAARGEPIDVDRLHGWWYAQRAILRSFPRTRDRLRWVRQRLFPAPAFLRAQAAHAHVGLPRVLADRLRRAMQRMFSRR